ncbi:unnamed protein product, partial [Ilex paraguariensis]
YSKFHIQINKIAYMILMGMTKTQGASASAAKPRSIRKEKGKGIATELQQPKSRKRQRAVYESNIVEKGVTCERMVDQKSLGKI